MTRSASIALFRPVFLFRRNRMAFSSPDPSICVLDAFRSSIAERVASALPPLTVDQVYSGVDYGKKGADFTIALPRFKLGKPEDVAAKVIAQVVLFCLYSVHHLIPCFVFLLVSTRRIHRVYHCRQSLLTFPMQKHDTHSRRVDAGAHPHPSHT